MQPFSGLAAHRADGYDHLTKPGPARADRDQLKMLIYLADLVYDTVKTNYVVPLNIGYLAALLDTELGSEVDIRLFKHPGKLETALKETPPDLLGLSNYSWNHRLNNVFLALFARVNPGGVSVMGGPHIRCAPEDIEAFLRARPDLDYYTPGEGDRKSVV